MMMECEGCRNRVSGVVWIPSASKSNACRSYIHSDFEYVAGVASRNEVGMKIRSTLKDATASDELRVSKTNSSD